MSCCCCNMYSSPQYHSWESGKTVRAEDFESPADPFLKKIAVTKFCGCPSLPLGEHPCTTNHFCTAFSHHMQFGYHFVRMGLLKNFDEAYCKTLRSFYSLLTSSGCILSGSKNHVWIFLSLHRGNDGRLYNSQGLLLHHTGTHDKGWPEELPPRTKQVLQDKPPGKRAVKIETIQNNQTNKQTATHTRAHVHLDHTVLLYWNVKTNMRVGSTFPCLKSHTSRPVIIKWDQMAENRMRSLLNITV